MQREMHLLICVRVMDVYVYMLCVTSSVFFMCTSKAFPLFISVMSAVSGQQGFIGWQDFLGWQAFVEDRTLLEYTVSCISLHLGKNYDAVCITGSMD